MRLSYDSTTLVLVLDRSMATTTAKLPTPFIVLTGELAETFGKEFSRATSTDRKIADISSILSSGLETSRRTLPCDVLCQVWKRADGTLPFPSLSSLFLCYGSVAWKLMHGIESRWLLLRLSAGWRYLYGCLTTQYVLLNECWSTEC